MAWLKLFGANLAVGGGKADQFGAAAEEFRRAAFVGDDMRRFVAVDRAIGRHQLRQRQRIGGGAGGDREYRHFGLEQLAGDGLQPRRQFIAAIGGCRSLRWQRRAPR